MTTREWLSIQRGDGHPTWGATWFTLGRLWFIWCVPNRPSSPGHPPIWGHPNKWMVVWRRKLPEWDQESYERVIRPLSTEEKNRYFAAKFPRIDDANGKPGF